MFESYGGSLDSNVSKCRRCGAFVSPQFARVFGDNDDQVYGCHECMSKTELYGGGSVESN